MNVELYRERRLQLELEPRRPMRIRCLTCLQPVFTCYCAHVRRFDAQIKFVILIHRLEVRRRIATGRLSHLCLHDSNLIMGYDYSQNLALNSLLEDPQYHPVILYPGRASTNISGADDDECRALFPQGKKPLIVVIDGTWNTAKKMLRRSRNLHGIKQICFTPSQPSNFRVRRQPRPECVSTVEAIHQVIELLGPSRGLDLEIGAHDNLLYVFNKMVEQQLEYMNALKASHGFSRHRRKPK